MHFLFLPYPHDFWRSAEEKQFYAQVAQAAGTVAVYSHLNSYFLVPEMFGSDVSLTLPAKYTRFRT